MLGKQEAIDKVWDWFIVQGKPYGTDTAGLCVFRGEDGRRCAVGVQISDEEYHPHMDCIAVSKLAEELDWGDDVVPLLRDLMITHDKAYRVRFDVDTFANLLRGVATRHDLVLPS